MGKRKEDQKTKLDAASGIEVVLLSDTTSPVVSPDADATALFASQAKDLEEKVGAEKNGQVCKTTDVINNTCGSPKGATSASSTQEYQMAGVMIALMMVMMI